MCIIVLLQIQFPMYHNLFRYKAVCMLRVLPYLQTETLRHMLHQEANQFVHAMAESTTFTECNQIELMVTEISSMNSSV